MPKRSGPIRVGDLTPEIIPALVVERDGVEVMLRGYVNGPRCPGRVKAQMASTGRRYTDATTVTVEQNEPDEKGVTSRTEFRADPVAYREYLRDAIDQVVIGLEQTEAEVLSGDEDNVNAILVYLKWLDDDGAAEEADADPEATGEKSTSESFSPSLLPSTDSEPTSS